MNSEYIDKDNMDAYRAEERKLEKDFQDLEIVHVLCDSRVATDILAKLGSDRAKVPPGVFIEELSAPSIKQPGEITPELPAPTTQILIVTPANIHQLYQRTRIKQGDGPTWRVCRGVVSFLYQTTRCDNP